MHTPRFSTPVWEPSAAEIQLSRIQMARLPRELDALAYLRRTKPADEPLPYPVIAVLLFALGFAAVLVLLGGGL